MDRTRNRGASLAATVALVALLVAGCGGARQQAESQQPESQQPTADSAAPATETAKGPTKDGIKPMPGYIAADIAATDVVTGKGVTLSELRGQVVFLNFWATWCPPCKEEMPEMEALHNELGTKVRIIALGADGRESPEKMAKYGEAMGLTFTLAHDGGSGARAYLIQGVPTSFFIDKNGKIQVRHTGPLTLDQMKEYLAQTEKATESTGQ